MSTLAHALILASGLLAVQASLWPYCNEFSYGSSWPDETYINTIAIVPGENEIQVTLNTGICGVHQNRTGTRAVACDAHANVDVTFLGMNNIQVDRDPDHLDSYAFVYFAAVCEPFNLKDDMRDQKVLVIPKYSSKKGERVFG